MRKSDPVQNEANATASVLCNERLGTQESSILVVIQVLIELRTCHSCAKGARSPRRFPFVCATGTKKVRVRKLAESMLPRRFTEPCCAKAYQVFRRACWAFNQCSETTSMLGQSAVDRHTTTSDVADLHRCMSWSATFVYSFRHRFARSRFCRPFTSLPQCVAMHKRRRNMPPQLAQILRTNASIPLCKCKSLRTNWYKITLSSVAPRLTRQEVQRPTLSLWHAG